MLPPLDSLCDGACISPAGGLQPGAARATRQVPRGSTSSRRAGGLHALSGHRDRRLPREAGRNYAECLIAGRRA